MALGLAHDISNLAREFASLGPCPRDFGPCPLNFWLCPQNRKRNFGPLPAKFRALAHENNSRARGEQTRARPEIFAAQAQHDWLCALSTKFRDLPANLQALGLACGISGLARVFNLRYFSYIYIYICTYIYIYIL